jgi:hypothetical protein
MACETVPCKDEVKALLKVYCQSLFIYADLYGRERCRRIPTHAFLYKIEVCVNISYTCISLYISWPVCIILVQG